MMTITTKVDQICKSLRLWMILNYDRIGLAVVSIASIVIALKYLGPFLEANPNPLPWQLPIQTKVGLISFICCSYFFFLREFYDFHWIRRFVFNPQFVIALFLLTASVPFRLNQILDFSEQANEVISNVIVAGLTATELACWSALVIVLGGKAKSWLNARFFGQWLPGR